MSPNGVECFIYDRYDPPSMALHWRRAWPGLPTEGGKVEDGRVIWIPEEEPGVWAPPTLALTWEQGQAFIEAVNKLRDPPTESVALRDALALERARVDRMVDSFLNRR